MLKTLIRTFPRPHPSLLFYWGGLLALLYVFAELAGDVYEHERIRFDAPILAWFHGIVTPPLTTLAFVLSFIGSVYVLAPGMLLIVLALWRVSKRSVIFFVTAFGGGIALNFAAKAFFARLRPDLFAQLSPEKSFSFPSGHTMASCGDMPPSGSGSRQGSDCFSRLASACHVRICKCITPRTFWRAGPCQRCGSWG
jgi:hypothetical protein